MKINITNIGLMLEELLSRDEHKNLTASLPPIYEFLTSLADTILFFKIPPTYGWENLFDMTVTPVLIEEFAHESTMVTEANVDDFYDFFYTTDCQNIVKDLIRVIVLNWPYANSTDASVEYIGGDYILDLEINKTDKRNIYYVPEQSVHTGVKEYKYIFNNEFTIFNILVPWSNEVEFKVFIENLSLLIPIWVSNLKRAKKIANRHSKEDIEEHEEDNNYKAELSHVVTPDNIKSMFDGLGTVEDRALIELAKMANAIPREPILNFNGWLYMDNSFIARYTKEPVK